MPGVQLIVRVLQDVTRREAFESYADLIEALKCRLAALHIRYDPAWIPDALARIERGGANPLIDFTRAKGHAPSVPPAPAVNRADARRICSTLQAWPKGWPR